MSSCPLSAAELSHTSWRVSLANPVAVTFLLCKALTLQLPKRCSGGLALDSKSLKNNGEKVND